MKKSHKIILLSVLGLLLAGVLFVVNSFFGNPVSILLAKHAAKEYLQNNFAERDYVIGDVGYNFKFDSYYAKITSPSSQDTYFSLFINALGSVKGDDYEQDVLSGWNTMERLNEEYRTIVDSVFEDSSFPYYTDLAFGEIASYEINDDALISQTFGIKQDTLEIDGAYDIREIAEKHGKIVFYADDDKVTVENAAKIILGIKKILTDNQVPFKAIDFTLQEPKKENGRGDKRVNVANFMFDDIYKDGMTERVSEANDKLNAYYAEQDAKMAKYEESLKK